MSTKQTLTTIAMLLIVLPALAVPPKPDPGNIPAYIQALQSANDPESIAIQQEIENGPAALAQEKKAADAEGVPLDLSVLEQPLPPPGQNAATLYAQLNVMRHQDPLKLPEYADSLGIGNAYTPQELAAVQKIISRHANQFQLLHQAARMPQYDVPKNWSLGYNVLFGELAQMRENARELVTESYLLAQQGHFQQAAADQALGFSIGRQVGSEPTLMNYLVAIAVNAVTLKGMENILYLAGPNLKADVAVEKAIQSNYAPLSLKTTLVGQAELDNVIFHSLWKDPTTIHDALYLYVPPTQQSPPLSSHQLAFARDFIDAAEAHYLSVILQLIPAANQPGADRRALFAALAPSGDAATSGSDSFDPIIALDSYFLDDQSLPMKADYLMDLRQIDMASADVLAVKADTGEYPAALPGQFIDSFNGKPMGYRLEGSNGFVVYSVGPHGTFNGGKPGQYQFVPYEQFFRYPAPPPKPVPADELK